MSQLWPSISSSRRTNDSTRRSTSKINKLRLSLGLNSPKSATILKNTPNHLISTSVVSSLSSIYRGLPERNSSVKYLKKHLASNSSASSKYTYRLDAAMLIVSRIKKFIYKHFNIWRLSVDRYFTAERRNQSTKSLVIQVTVSREKKRFHSISKNPTDLQFSERSPKSEKFSKQSQGELKLSGLFQAETGKKCLGIESQKNLFHKKMFKSFGNDEKLFSKFSFESGPVKPFARNKAYVNQAERKKRLGKIFEILEKRYWRNINDCFFTILAVLVFKLNFLKILVNMTRRLKVRMHGIFYDILKESENVARGWRMSRVLRNVGKVYLNEVLRRITFSYKLNLKVGVRDSIESLKKNIREILNAKPKAEKVENFKNLREKSKNFLIFLNSGLKNSLKSLLKETFNQIYTTNIKMLPKNQNLNFDFSHSNSSSIEIEAVKEGESPDQTKSIKKLIKNLIKEKNFRCKKCFIHWKEITQLQSSKDIFSLKTQTVFNILKGILDKTLKHSLNSLKTHKNFPKKVQKTGFKVKLLKAIKRISKHLNFYKAKAFQKFKYFRPIQRPKKLETKFVTISQFVKILKSKVWRNFRYFYTKASQN